MADQEPPKRKGNPNWVPGGPSPNPSGKMRRDAATPTAVAPMRMGAWLESIGRMDGWSNALTGMGLRGRDKAMHTRIEVEPVDGEEALQIWRGDAMGARIVETPPREALRQGYELQIGENEIRETYKPPDPPPTPQAPAGSKPSPQAKQSLAQAKADAALAFVKRYPSAFDRRVYRAITRQRVDAGDAKPIQAAITKLFEKLHVNEALKEVLCYRRAYGGGAILIGANDYTTDLREPLDLKRVRSLDWLTPLEARELIPLYWYNNPRAPKFGRPAIYQLIPYVIGNPVDGGANPVTVTQIHESRLLIFDGTRVSRRITSTATWGWGDSIFTRIKRALRAFNTGHQNAETLLADFAQAVYKIKNLADVLAQEGSGGGSLADKLIAVDMARSIIRAIAIDSDEEFERKSTSLAGYPETLDRLALWLCAVSGMPATMLMGQSPAGMNATGASDIRLFYDQISSDQTLEVAPAIMRLVEIGIAAMGEDPESVPCAVKFRALWQPTAAADAQAHLTQAQADAIYLDREVTSPEEIALSRFGGDRFSLETYLDFEARANQEAVVAPVVDAKPKKPAPAIVGDPYALTGAVPGPIPPAAIDPEDDPNEPDRMDAQRFALRRDFDPDQPRDEHGQFTGGDGAVTSSVLSGPTEHERAAVERIKAMPPQAGANVGNHAWLAHQPAHIREKVARDRAKATAHAEAATARAIAEKTPAAHTVAAEAHRSAEAGHRSTGSVELAERHARVAGEHEKRARKLSRGDFDEDQPREEDGKFAGGGAHTASKLTRAETKSAKANAASAHAAGAPSKESHEAAGVAHREAEGAHKVVGNEPRSASHDAAVDHHEKEAKRHEKESGESHSLLASAAAIGSLVVGKESAELLGLGGEGGEGEKPAEPDDDDD